ncbi:MAG TPA: energy transducer TonB [Candidatus Sulfotelmatobacter sp.]|nr:energy transducer TonB [Candidatus Sulfotelmatobacter sp.]
MMELSQRRMVAARAPIAPANQQSRLVIALALLLVALAAVLIKDRQFWFGSESTIVDADYVQPTVAPQVTPQVATQIPTKPAVTTPAPVHAAKKQVAVAATPSAPAKPADAPAVISNRTVLPPLDVEVIAGDSHHKVHPGNNSKRLEITNPAASVARQAAPVAAPATNAAERQRLAEAIPPSYPPLAQHMNVQGSVVLQALIAADGRIQNLRVMSGPAILATAAQQAVRDWKFKPVFQNGMAVETKATITVNFTIRVADSAANTTLAENDDVTISQ